MENIGIASVAAITVAAYIVGALAKLCPIIPDKAIPVICGMFGGLLGVVALLWLPIPDYPATDPISAFAVGVVSGLAATGANQVFKQLGKEDAENG